MTAATAEVIDQPTPWIWRAWQYTRALRRGAGSGDTVSTDAFVLNDQAWISTLIVKQRGMLPPDRRPKLTPWMGMA